MKCISDLEDLYPTTMSSLEEGDGITNILTDEQEDAMWDIPFKDAELNSERLLAALIFVISKYFGMKGEEMFNLDPDQNMEISISEDGKEVVTIYREGSETTVDTNGIRKHKKNLKHVVHAELVTDRRGFYYWYKLYESRLPQKRSGFWQHPITEIVKKQFVWYHQTKRLGVNYFNVLMKKMFSLAGLPDRLTLRSVKSKVTRKKNRAARRLMSGKQQSGSMILQKSKQSSLDVEGNAQTTN